VSPVIWQQGNRTTLPKPPARPRLTHRPVSIGTSALTPALIELTICENWGVFRMITYSVFRLAARGRRPVLATFKAGIGAGERKTLLR